MLIVLPKSLKAEIYLVVLLARLRPGVKVQHVPFHGIFYTTIADELRISKWLLPMHLIPARTIVPPPRNKYPASFATVHTWWNLTLQSFCHDAPHPGSLVILTMEKLLQCAGARKGIIHPTGMIVLDNQFVDFSSISPYLKLRNSADYASFCE